MRNFTNGSLVFRIWRSDGGGEVIGGEVIAKFAYMTDAKLFAESYVKRADRSDDWFLLAVCEYECDVQTFTPSKAEGRSNA